MFYGHRVLIVTTDLNRGMKSFRISQIAQAFQCAGWDVAVASEGGALAEPLDHKGIVQHELSFKWGEWWTIRRFRKIFNSTKYHLVVVLSPEMCAVVESAYDELRFPWVLGVFSHHELPNLETIGKVRKIVAMNDRVKDQLIQEMRGFFDAQRVVTLPFGVDEDYFSSKNRSEEIRSLWNIDKNSYVIGTAVDSSNLEQSNPEQLFKQLAFPDNKAWRLAVLGADETVKNLAKEVGIEDQVVWIDEKVTEPQDFLEGCNVFVSSGRNLALLPEAMMMGLPVVTYRKIGVDKALNRNEGGYLLSLGDAVGLQKSLENLEAKFFRETMGKLARAQAKKYFNFGQVAHELNQIYEDIKGI